MWLLRELMLTAAAKYKVTKVDGTTYEGSDGMPWKIYKRLGFSKVTDLFLVQIDAGKLFNWVK